MLCIITATLTYIPTISIHCISFEVQFYKEISFKIDISSEYRYFKTILTTYSKQYFISSYIYIALTKLVYFVIHSCLIFQILKMMIKIYYYSSTGSCNLLSTFCEPACYNITRSTVLKCLFSLLSSLLEAILSVHCFFDVPTECIGSYIYESHFICAV